MKCSQKRKSKYKGKEEKMNEKKRGKKVPWKEFTRIHIKQRAVSTSRWALPNALPRTWPPAPTLNLNNYTLRKVCLLCSPYLLPPSFKLCSPLFPGTFQSLHAPTSLSFLDHSWIFSIHITILKTLRRLQIKKPVLCSFTQCINQSPDKKHGVLKLGTWEKFIKGTFHKRMGRG